MFIEPNSEVYLLHTSLPSDYTDTIYFDTIDEQVNWFINRSTAHLSGQTYQRVNLNTFRCSLPMSQTYNVDYMMFKNTSFENKWFYAFVTSIDYKNNGLCNIHYTIDVIQTWFAGGQASLGNCYVSREMSTTDNIGDNIEPESIALGEYVSEQNSRKYMAQDFFEPVIIVGTAGGTKTPNASGMIIDHTFTGATLRAYSQAESVDINDLIDRYTTAGQPDGIIGMWMAPKLALPHNEIPDGHIVLAGSNLPTTETEPRIDADSGFNGYIPKNNKLYTYPYNFCRVETTQGNKADYRYEFFAGLTPKFSLKANILPPCGAQCGAMNYKHYSYDLIEEVVPNECIVIQNYPMCSWNYDTYAAWVAQNSVPMANVRGAWEDKAKYELAKGAMNAIQSAASGASMGSMVQPLGATMTAVNAVAMGLSSFGTTLANLGQSKIDLVLAQQNADYSASIEANTMGGTITSGSLGLAGRPLYFEFSRWHLNDDRIRAIDDYFNMFGYATNRTKVPNINSRPHWNYVQTIDCNIHGDMPSDDRQAIKAIFDHGVRFWKNGDEIGRYDLDNRPNS